MHAWYRRGVSTGDNEGDDGIDLKATLFPGAEGDWGGTENPTNGGTERPVTLMQTDEGTRPRALRMPMERYVEIGLLGTGGAGVVRQVLDRTLNRLVAVKTLRDLYAENDQMVRRFVHEAQIVAQLEHPAIVPVHDLGQLPDGQWFITMTEIRGEDFDRIVRRFHHRRAGGPLAGLHAGWTLRRMVDTLNTICKAVGFAHTKGVIHRDLKPENVMIGDHGEIRVVDWGLAKIIGSEDRDEYDALLADQGDHWSEASPDKTRYGVVAGTPAYMPPEQAAGRHDDLGTWTDVWALGGVLYSILYGTTPYRGTAREVVQKVLDGPPEAPPGSEAHEALVGIWTRAMSMDPAERYRDANEMSEELAAYIEGSMARERANRLVEAGRQVFEQDLPARQDAARERRNAARKALQQLRPTDALPVKEAAWRLEEEAERLLDEVETLFRKVAGRGRAALAQVPDLPEARSLLADLYRQRAELAQEGGDLKALREYQGLLAENDDGRHAEYLNAEGQVSFATSQPAEVAIYRFRNEARRLQPKLVAGPLRTPLSRHTLEAGSYLAVLRAEGCEAVRYPFVVERGGHWDGCEPGGAKLAPIQLPKKGALSAGDRYVPGGWLLVGGDAEARGALGRRRIWVDGFVLRDRPVTHQEYLVFLNDLVQRGHASSASAYCPRVVTKGKEAPVYVWNSDGWDEVNGRWVLPTGGADVAISADAPAVYVNWYQASAYCRWAALRTKTPWRLPGELEREKAARGVDGRAFPWGDQSDPAFHCMQLSALDHPGAPPTAEYPVDASPYFVHGLAGGVLEWCSDRFQPYGPPIKGSRAVQPSPPTAEDLKRTAHAPRRVVRGGAWDLDARSCRAAGRLGLAPERAQNNVGFRLCRSL